MFDYMEWLGQLLRWIGWDGPTEVVIGIEWPLYLLWDNLVIDSKYRKAFETFGGQIIIGFEMN